MMPEVLQKKNWGKRIRGSSYMTWNPDFYDIIQKVSG